MILALLVLSATALTIAALRTIRVKRAEALGRKLQAQFDAMPPEQRFEQRCSWYFGIMRASGNPVTRAEARRVVEAYDREHPTP